MRATWPQGPPLFRGVPHRPPVPTRSVMVRARDAHAAPAATVVCVCVCGRGSRTAGTVDQAQRTHACVRMRVHRTCARCYQRAFARRPEGRQCERLGYAASRGVDASPQPPPPTRRSLVGQASLCQESPSRSRARAACPRARLRGARPAQSVRLRRTQAASSPSAGGRRVGGSRRRGARRGPPACMQSEAISGTQRQSV